MDKSELSKAEKINLSYLRFHSLARAARLTRQEVLDGLPVVELFQTDAMAVDTSLALMTITHFTIGLGTILHLAGDRTDLDDVIESMLKVEVMCPALLTELGYGNNVQSLETEARYDAEAEEFVIHTPNDRALKFISYTGYPGKAKTGLVYARLWDGERDCGVHPFLVPIRDADGSVRPGITIRAVVDRMTPDPMDHAITRFDQVRVPRRMFLGGAANTITADGHFQTELADNRAVFLHTMGRLDYAKLSLIVGALKMARVSLTLAFEFAAQRTITARGGATFPVSVLPSQQVPLMCAYARFRAAEVLYRQAVDKVSGAATGVDDDIVSISKYTSIPLAVDTIQTCVERCGSHAYMERNRLSTYLVTALHANTADGDAMPLALQVARNMMRAGSDYRPPWVERDVPGFAAMLARREHAVYAELAARLARTPWPVNLNLAHDLARTRATRIALEALEAEDPEVAILFGLLAVREHGAWFATSGTAGAAELAGLDDRIEERALQLYANVADIRKRLDVEEFVAGMPMGQPDYVAAWAAL
ncbi:MAG: acyl-CoA dehydrogenase family protein [Mycobacteriales bacterium]